MARTEAGRAPVLTSTTPLGQLKGLLPASLRPTVRRALVRWRHVGLVRGDVALVSYPKSGSTWLRFLLAHALTGREADFDSVRETVPPVGRHRTAPRLVPGEHRLVRTHEPLSRLPSRVCGRVIYLVRDGRDVALSYMRHLERTGAFDGDLARFVPEFLAGTPDGYGPWSEHVLGAKAALETGGRSVLVVRYEDLRHATTTTLDGVLRFIGADVLPEIVSAAVEANDRTRMQAKEAHSKILRSQNRSDIPFVSTGTGPAWQDLLGSEEAAAFSDALAPALAAFGYLPTSR